MANEEPEMLRFPGKRASGCGLERDEDQSPNHGKGEQRRLDGVKEIHGTNFAGKAKPPALSQRTCSQSVGDVGFRGQPKRAKSLTSTMGDGTSASFATFRLQCSKRRAPAFANCSSSSIETHRLCICSATNPVVFDPAKGSKTKSPSLVRNFRKNSANWGGNRAGCGFNPNALHALM